MNRFFLAVFAAALLAGCSDAASPYRYRVIFKPSVILPDIDPVLGLKGKP